jgi:L-arabinose isomerase
VAVQSQVTEAEVTSLVAEYEAQYLFADNCKEGKDRAQVLRAAVKRLLCAGSCKKKAPRHLQPILMIRPTGSVTGTCLSRLMAEGYGFGAEVTGKRLLLHGRYGL